MKIIDLIDPTNTKQKIGRYNEKMNDEIYSFLDSFKCNGEELVVNQMYDALSVRSLRSALRRWSSAGSARTPSTRHLSAEVSC